MSDKFKLFSIVPDSTKEEALNPASNLIGQAFRGIAHLVLDPLVKLNIARDYDIESYAQKIRNNSSEIPEEFRDASMIGLAYKTVEDSVYQLQSEQMQTWFANLISATIDSRKNTIIKPSFSSILKDLSPVDAELFQLIYLESPVAIGGIRLENKDTGNGVNVLENVIITESNEINQQSALDTLQRFGLIKIEPDKNLIYSKYVCLYNKFEESETYKEYTKNLPHDTETTPLNVAKFLKGNIKLTTLGNDFGSVVISD